MRTDVKLGVVFALVLVLATGGYFAFRGNDQAPIPVADSQKPAATAAKSGAAKPAPAVTPNKTPPRNTAVAPNRNGNQPAKPNINPSPPRVVTTPGAPSPAVTDSAVPRPSNPSVAKPSETVAGKPTGPSAAPPVTVPAPTAADRPATAIKPAVSNPAVADSKPPASGADIGLTAMRNAPSVPSSQPAFTPLTNAPATTTPGAPAPNSNHPAPNRTGPEPVGARTTPSRSDSNVAIETHRVQPGDSLSTLAQTYYGDSKYAGILAEANPDIRDPNVLRVGTQVKIPALPADAAARLAAAPPADPSAAKAPAKDAAKTAGKRTYTVKSGDSFYSIAKSQLGNANRWKELLSLNHSLVHGDPTSLQPGQRLVLPES